MITEGLICTRCAHPLEVEEVIDVGDEDYGFTYILICKHCGAKYESKFY